MTQWLFHGTPPAGFTIDDECEIRENDEPGGTIRCKNIDITQGAVRKHLENQAQVVKLALSWNDRISFIFDQEFTLRRIKPLEVIDNLREENDDLDAEVLFVADMILFQAEVRGLIKRLLEILVVK
jgi:recombination associated protein RdgC